MYFDCDALSGASEDSAEQGDGFASAFASGSLGARSNENVLGSVSVGRRCRRGSRGGKRQACFLGPPSPPAWHPVEKNVQQLGRRRRQQEWTDDPEDHHSQGSRVSACGESVERFSVPFLGTRQ